MPVSGFRRFIAVAGLCALLLAGCQPPPPPLPEPEPPKVPEPALSEVEILLERARVALDNQHLTLPAENSAFALYEEVLLLEPGNDDAHRGIEDIVERYVRFALGAIQRRQFSRARTMLARARLVDAGHPAIDPTEEQMRLMENAKRDQVPLEPSALAERSVILVAVLRGIGARAKASSCRVIIYTPSDAAGRWVYRQLNSASGNARIRARLEIASSPFVELICPQRSS